MKNRSIAAAAALLAATAAFGAPGDGYRLVKDAGAVRIYARDSARGGVRELRAEGRIAANPACVRDMLTDVDHMAGRLPYVAEARNLPLPAPPHARVTYQRISAPVVSDRDQVLLVTFDEDLRPDGSGRFRDHWSALPDAVPAKNGVVRVRVSDGSWTLERCADDPSKTCGVYDLHVDPGGALPTFVANMANERALPDLFATLARLCRR